jgi:Domain of unknown function (DUF6265)
VLTGHRSGASAGKPTEEFCSSPTNGLLVCFFRELGETPPLVEVSTLREVDGTIEVRVRHFSPLLERWEGNAPLVFRLQSLTNNESVVASVNPNAVAKRVVPSRQGDEMTSRVEVVNDQGKAIFIEAKIAEASRKPNLGRGAVQFQHAFRARPLGAGTVIRR